MRFVGNLFKAPAKRKPKISLAYTLIFASLTLILYSPHIYAVQQSNATDTVELETIKTLIAQTQAQLQEKLADSERLQQELKLAELQIAQTATLLNTTDTKLLETREKLANLEQEKSQIRAQIKIQQTALASQIKSAYMAGDYDFAKMIFNQDEANKFERTLTYYQYLNKARQAEIESFIVLVKDLEDVQVQLDQQEKQLTDLVSQQAKQANQLANQQQARFAAFSALEKQIASDQAKVNQLQQQENDLLSAIEQAEIEAQNALNKIQQENIQLLGLASLQRKLSVPASGKIQRLFGKRRQGQVRWKGIVINAKSGAPVSAVADGIVLYSNWLKGFGLVTIIDHGEGYMTVYGRNQTLLKKVGEVVKSGDVISLVGTSGGQVRAGLYFEIRHKGKALDPNKWLAR